MTGPRNQLPTGFENLASERGELEDRAHVLPIAVPASVVLDGGYLVFASYALGEEEVRRVVNRGERTTGDDWESRRHERLPDREVHVGRGVLEKFAMLHDRPDSHLLAFAKRWGGLLICKHGLPCTHGEFIDGKYVECYPLGYGGESWCEPLSAWRNLSARTHAMLRAAAQIKSGGRPNAADWMMMVAAPESRTAPIPPEYEAEILWVATVAQRWLTMGKVATTVQVTERGRIKLVLSCQGLFGLLAYQLSLAVSGSTGEAVCFTCQALYEPTRRPRHGERNYCDDCRDAGAPQRDAKRDHRARLAGAKTRSNGTAATSTEGIPTGRVRRTTPPVSPGRKN